MPKSSEYPQKTSVSLPQRFRGTVLTISRSVRDGAKKAGSDMADRFSRVRTRVTVFIAAHPFCSKAPLPFLAALFTSLAALPQEVHPFAAALLVSLTERDEMLAAWLGASLGALFCRERALPLLLLYFLLFVTRKAFTESRYHEKLGIRIAEGAAAAAVSGAVRVLLRREALSYAVIAAVMGVIVCGCAVYLFSVLFDGQTAAKVGVGLKCAGIYVFAGMPVLALQGVRLFGVRVDIAAACVLTMVYAVKCGFMHAGIIGFVCGLSCADPVLCASMGLSGIVCALVGTRNRAGAFGSFALCIFCCQIYGSGPLGALRILPEVVCAVGLFWPVCRFLPDLMKPVVSPAPRAVASASERANVRKQLSDALFSVSDVFAGLSEKHCRPSYTDVSVNVEKAFADVCASCALSEMCYAKRNTPADELTQMLYAVLAVRPAEGADFGQQMKDKCIRLDALCETVNRLYAEDAAKCAADDRPALLASGYASMARMVDDLAGSEWDAAGRDRVFEDAVGNALRGADIPFSQLTVRSERDKRTTVYGVDPSRIPIGTEELKRRVYAESGIRIGEITFDIGADGAAVMRFARAPLIRLEYASASRKREDEDVNGDTAAVFDGSRDRTFALLCDGMGSGRDAAAASRLCAVFLEKLSYVGLGRQLLLEMLNNALLSQPGEHFSTVDYMEADLLTGRCTFVKAGAAPSYILRGSRLYKIVSETPPVGILPSFTAESTRFDVKPGDWIFLISDGVLADKAAGDVTEGDGIGELAWLSGMMRDALPADPALVAERILEKAAAPSASDDRTAVVIRVCEAIA